MKASPPSPRRPAARVFAPRSSNASRVAVVIALAIAAIAARPGAAGAQTSKKTYGSQMRGSYAITHPLERPANPRMTAPKGRTMRAPAVPDPVVREPRKISAFIPDPSPNRRALGKGTSIRRGRYFYERPGELRMAEAGQASVVHRPLPPSPAVRRPPSTSREALKMPH